MSLTSRSSVGWPEPARRVLLLGGTRSGKSAVAESLLANAPSVRYVATAAGDDADPAWRARVRRHVERRPDTWVTEETGGDPARLTDLIAAAKPDESLLVDDLGGWLTAVLAAAGTWDDPDAADAPGTALAEAVAACPAARLVVVSPEVGLSVVPASEAGRTFADAQGTLNRRIADACDAVALVVAGRAAWLTRPAPQPAPAPVGVRAATQAAWDADLAAADATGAPDPAGAVVPPVGRAPDEAAGARALGRLGRLDVPGAGLGALAAVVEFAAATQDRDDPRPWQRVRVVLLHGDHAGGAAAGDPPAEAARRLAAACEGTGPLSLLAAGADATIDAVECPATAAIEETDALTVDEVEAALAHGRHLADSAVDAGADLLVVASCGTGGAAAATAVASLIGGGEPAALLPRAVRADGRVDDAAWMRRCVAVRDALHRVRNRPRDAKSMLAAIGGGDLAVAAGLILGAADRRTPVLIDGPVGASAALLARDIEISTPRWLMLADDGGQPTVKLIATMLGVKPLLDLRLDLGEGAGALAALPLLRAALTVATTARDTPEPPEPPEAPTTPEAAPGEPPSPAGQAPADDG